MKKLLPLAACLGLSCAWLGLGTVAPTATAAAQVPGRQFVVPMANMKYGRVPSGLKVGDTIIWVNRDTVPHTVTARDRSFDLRMNPGQKARMTLRKSGRFAFYCTLHPLMRGTLAVATK